MWGMEPEPAVFYNQARLPKEGLGHQPSHKTFNLQFVLPIRYRGKDGAEIEGIANQCLVHVETHAMRGSPLLILLVIFWSTCRKEPRIITIREVSPRNWWKQMQRPIAKHQAELEESCERRGGMICRSQRSRIETRNLQNQLTWASRASQSLSTNQRSYMGLT